MPWYRVTYRPEVAEDLASVEKEMAQRLLEKTKWLASNAANLRHEPLADDLPALAKYTVGEWCIVYALDAGKRLVDVHLIGRRKDLYRPRGTRRA